MERYSEFAFKILLILIFSMSISRANYANAQADSWKKGRLFRSALTVNVRFQSTGTIADDLASLSRNSRVAILLDREIDPSQKISFPNRPQPLGKTLEDIAEKLGGLSITVGSFVYVVPKEKAFRWLTVQKSLAYEFSRVEAGAKKKLDEASKMNWDSLATPRDIVSVLAANCGLKINNPELIPHDLWAARDLPMLSNGEQIAFLLASMNRSLTVDSDRKTIRIIELSPDQVFTMQYRKTDQRKIDGIVSASKLVRVKTVVRGNEYFVRGPLSENMVIADKMRMKRPWKTTIKPGSKNVFDLNTNASRGGILATIAKNRSVKLVFAPNVAETLKQKIKVEVKQATVEELLAETLKGTGLRYQLTETQLIISK